MKYPTLILIFFLLIHPFLNAQSSTSDQSGYPQTTAPTSAPAPPDTAAVSAEPRKKDSEKGIQVGGGFMFASKDIIINLADAQDFSSLLAALKKANLAETLQGKGTYTVFAPSNEAFAKIPSAQLDSLMTPKKESELTAILTYHIISGKMGLKDIVRAIRKGNGEAMLKTVSGSQIRATIENETMTLTDENGHKAHVSRFDIEQNNGVLHVLDDVMMPKQKM
ncbi:MAG: fasciclin domain-containing protein [Mucilaginibacter polytrichastri]|nr:fasciclin domain-containing protein [Mucilaginibacter polytrichastri]